MIHALPGMGADRRMFPAPWSSLPGFVAHDWIQHAGERSLAEVAESMCQAAGIQDGDILVGASLGGMVGCEITKIRRIPLLFLVGSAARKEEVNGVLARFHPLVRAVPIDLLRRCAGKIPMAAAQMFAGVEPSFMRAMCFAVFTWPGLGASSTRVLRLHGKRDWVIPPPAHVDLLLEARHLISMSHAQICVDFVREHLSLEPAAR